MKTTGCLPALGIALLLPFSSSRGQITDQTADFSASLPWGHGSCQLKWDRIPASIKARGEDGMSENSGECFPVIDTGLWTPVGERDRAEATSTYTIKPEDAGRKLSAAVVVLSKQEIAEGLPVIATSEWKITVTD